MSTFSIISLIVEFSGLSLAVLEFFFPDKADFIEIRIDSFSVSFRRWSTTLTYRNNLQEIDIVTYIKMPLYLIFYYCIAQFFFFASLDFLGFMGMALVIVNLVFVCLAISLSILANFIDLLNRVNVTDGRALGTVGVLLACIGAIMELFSNLNIS